MKTAITGGIGSGKSYVCQMLKEQGIEIYDCDSAAKRLMRTSKRLKEQLKALVGSNVYIGGRLNKPVLAQFLLASDDNQKAVNAIVHPAVADDFIASGMEWMECAILFESGFDRLVDRIVCVTAPHETRPEEWINCQMPQEEVAQRSDIIICNDGSPLLPQLSSLLEHKK